MKVMLLAYEVDSYAMCELAQHFERDGHEAWIVNGDYYSFIDNTSIRNWYLKQGFTRWVNYEEEYRKLYTEEYVVDWEYLESFEKQYCKTKKLQQLIMSDSILSRSNHCRFPYYSIIESSDQLYYWVELQLRWCESLFMKLAPDVVFTIGENYFVKNVIWQIAHSQDIHIFNLIDTRVHGKHRISDNFGYGTDSAVRSFIANEKLEAEDLVDAKEYIDHFSDSMFSTNLGTPVEMVIRDSWLNPKAILLDLFHQIKHAVIHRVTKKKMYGGFFRSNYFNSSTILVILYFCRRAMNQLRFRWNSPCFSQLPSMPFIYMPLHLLPESSTLTLSIEQYEIDLIRFIAKELPIGMSLVVKEHPMMVGDRPFEFYSELEKLPNVILLDPRYPSKEMVKESRGVTGISGTALLEAAMLQKHTHAFGKPEFLDVIEFQGHSEFQEFVEHCAGNFPPLKFDKVLRYVKYMLDKGVELPLKAVLYKRRSQSFYEGTATIYQMLLGRLVDVGIIKDGLSNAATVEMDG